MSEGLGPTGGTAHELAPDLGPDGWQRCVLCGTRINHGPPVLPWGTITIVENFVQRGTDARGEAVESPPRRAILAGRIGDAAYCALLTPEVPHEQR